jgi:hypothetical protein
MYFAILSKSLSLWRSGILLLIQITAIKQSLGFLTVTPFVFRNLYNDAASMAVSISLNSKKSTDSKSPLTESKVSFSLMPCRISC